MPMDDAARITLTACWQRMQSWSDAQSMVALSAAAGSPHQASDRWVAADVALSTHLSEHAVEARLAYVRRVGDCLPCAWEALNAGQSPPPTCTSSTTSPAKPTRDIAEQVDAESSPKRSSAAGTRPSCVTPPVARCCASTPTAPPNAPAKPAGTAT